MWTLGLDEGLGLATNADDGFSINKWKTLDFGEINYTSKQCSQLPTTDLKVKLLEWNCVLFHRPLFHGWALSCSKSQKNVMFNEPNRDKIMPVIFGTHTKQDHICRLFMTILGQGENRRFSLLIAELDFTMTKYFGSNTLPFCPIKTS